MMKEKFFMSLVVVFLTGVVLPSLAAPVLVAAERPQTALELAQAQIPQPPQVPQPPGQPGPLPVPQAPVTPVPVPPERRLLPPPSVPSGGMVSLNFTRADLIEIIHIIAQHLKLTYTIDPEVKGTVTINSAEPLRSEDLLPIFHQILRMNGAVAVRAGNIYRITPIRDGKGLARPVGQSREDSFALQIVPVRFFSVTEMKKVLTPFVMPGGEIIDNPRGNFLIIMDLPSNIQRLVEIADLIDVQVFAGARMEIYQPRVA
ncbi:MAG TPA: secretin N-terminal domain-containing protein, partial [Methylomirabilota bacterium]|nr:secretin N-terminal domain-containing protein [Methylomirabilota bacterium]